MEPNNPEPDHLVSGRLEKHHRIVPGGGYPDRFERSHLAAALHTEFEGLASGEETDRRVGVAGRLMLHRSFGKLQFGTLQDASGSIQLLVDKAHVDADTFDEFADADLGDWLGAEGVVMTTRKGELSVKVDHLVPLRKSLRPLPEKYHGLHDVEARSRHRYLDLLVNEESRRVALERTRIVGRLRNEFFDRGFVEVETPVLLTQATGALARPFATRHNALDMEMYLRIATELYLKRLVVGGLERVFEIGRIFRNEGVDSTHNPEFTMLEAYQALANYEDILVLIEEVVAAAAAEVGRADVEIEGRSLSLTPPYRRVEYLDLVSESLGETVGLDTPIEKVRVLAAAKGVEIEESWDTVRVIEEVYEELAEGSIWEPTFVLHPPVEVSPLARRNDDDPRLADRFELVIAGAEYVNAFSELNDTDDQRARFVEQAQAREAGDEDAHPVDEDYLRALEYGLPPTGGLGIGVDRLVMLLTGQSHIREVILFPTLKPEQRED
jgi:lysyl-tRNA synthetase class 2